MIDNATMVEKYIQTLLPVKHARREEKYRRRVMNTATNDFLTISAKFFFNQVEKCCCRNLKSYIDWSSWKSDQG